MNPADLITELDGIKVRLEVLRSMTLETPGTDELESQLWRAVNAVSCAIFECQKPKDEK